MSREAVVMRSAPHRPRAHAPTLLAGLAQPVEAAIAALILVILSTTPSTVLAHLLGEGGAAAPARALQFAGFAAAGIGLCMRRRYVRVLSWPSVFGAAFLALAAASIVWSIDPGLTGRRLIVFAGAYAASLYLATFPMAQLARLTARTMLVLALLGLVVALLAPPIGRMVETHFGAYRGLWGHKNLAGLTLALGLAAALACAAHGRRIWLLAAPFYGALAVWTDSSTTLLCMALVGAAFGLVWAIRRGPAVAAAVVSGALAVGASALVVGPALLRFVAAALDRDRTFTGRTEVWAAVLRQMESHPWGFGYGAFWDAPGGPVATVDAEIGYAAGSAHNGWLDAAVHFGWPGAALLVAFMAACLVAVVAGSARTRGAYFFAGVLAVLLGSATSESLLLRPDALHWPLLLASAVAFTARGRTP